LPDETPSKALDVQADDMDVAVLVDWLEKETRLAINRVDAQWAGLRTFTEDGSPIVGFDAKAPGFFWLAGQGGYGIMMAPALSKLATQLILERDPGCGHSQVDLQGLSPSRFH